MRPRSSEFVTSFASERHCPSLAWGCGHRTVRWRRRERSAAVTERTVYRIASMTKSFSAAATLLLRDEGVLRLDDRCRRPRARTRRARPLRLGSDHDSRPAHDDERAADRRPVGRPAPRPHRRRVRSDHRRRAAVRPTDGQHASSTPTSGTRVARTSRTSSERSTNPGHDLRASARPARLGPTTWTRPDHDDWARPIAVDRRRRCDSVRRRVGTARRRRHRPDGRDSGRRSPISRSGSRGSMHAFPARTDPDDGPLCRASRREMQSFAAVHRYCARWAASGRPTATATASYVLDDPALGRVDHAIRADSPATDRTCGGFPGRRVGVDRARQLDLRTDARAHGPAARPGRRSGPGAARSTQP